jgi:hypothetical protein
MLCPKFVFLLLLSLGLVGCWEGATRLRVSPPGLSGQYGASSSAQDDLPTPRLFQVEHSAAPEE